MRTYDVTVPLRAEMPAWEGETGPRLEWRSRIEQGGDYDLSVVTLSSHSGTHVDAPAHYEAGGPTVESLAADTLVGPAVVVEHGRPADITAADLEALGVDGGRSRVLFKTVNGALWDDAAFHRDYVALARDGAERLVELGVRLVGIDYLSIESFESPGFRVHHTLLGAGVVVLEGVDLRRVPPGEYLLVCAPLPMAGAEGAPARVFLIDEVSDGSEGVGR